MSRITNRRLIAVGILVATLAVIVGGGLISAGAGQNAALLKAAVRNMRAAQSYHISSHDRAGSQTLTSSWDVDRRTQRWRADMKVSGQSFTIIAVGDNGYFSTDGGRTFTSRASLATEVKVLNEFIAMWDKLSDDEVDHANLLDGSPTEEVVDGVPTRRMTTTTKALPTLSTGSAGGIEGTVELWVSTDAQPTVRQMRETGKARNSLNVTVITDAVTNDQWSNFNQPLNIMAPTPSR